MGCSSLPSDLLSIISNCPFIITDVSIEQIYMQTEYHLQMKGKMFPVNHHHPGTLRGRCKCILLNKSHVTWLPVLSSPLRSIIGKCMEHSHSFRFSSQCSCLIISIHNFLIVFFATVGKEWKVMFSIHQY